MKKIRVIVVDDSAFIRELFCTILNSDPDIEVVETACDPYDAREKIKLHNPDMITLDIEMPKMDGVEFLKKIMKLRPMPVLMISSLTQKGSKATIEALSIGAVDYLPKIDSDKFATDLLSEQLIAKVKEVALAKVKSRSFGSKQNTEIAETVNQNWRFKEKSLIAIGASTGGVEALRTILSMIPKNCPPIIITQHMLEQFVEAFTLRLNNTCAARVKIVENKEILSPGVVYVAPGDLHMEIRLLHHDRYQAFVLNQPKVSGHRPSVDVMFDSLAKLESHEKHIVGVILTGMGADGANALLNMRKNGCYTIGQNEESCVVYGMPKVAYELGGVAMQLPLNKIANEMLKQST